LESILAEELASIQMLHELWLVPLACSFGYFHLALAHYEERVALGELAHNELAIGVVDLVSSNQV
jgi:hypothetical protein